MTDPIADMLTRIRNAQMVNKREVVIPFSRVKFDVAKILKTQKFVSAVKKVDSTLLITLKKDGIKGIDRVSKPGQRVYQKYTDLNTQYKYGKGSVIVSTSKGVMDARSAKKDHLGGEVICQVW